MVQKKIGNDTPNCHSCESRNPVSFSLQTEEKDKTLEPRLKMSRTSVEDDRTKDSRMTAEEEARLRGFGLGLRRGLLNHVEVFLGDEIAIGKQSELIPARSRKDQSGNIHAEIMNLQPVLDFNRRQ